MKKLQLQVITESEYAVINRNIKALELDYDLALQDKYYVGQGKIIHQKIKPSKLWQLKRFISEARINRLTYIVDYRLN